MTASQLREWAAALEDAAVFAPRFTCDFALWLLRAHVEPESREIAFYGTTIIDPEVTRDHLPRLLLRAAYGAVVESEPPAIINALVHCARREQRLGAAERLRRTGTSVGAALQETLSSFDIPAGFTPVAEDRARRLLSEDTPEVAREAARALFGALLQRERHSMGARGTKVTLTSYPIPLDSEAGRARTELRDRLWELLNGEPESQWRSFAWELLATTGRGGMVTPDDDPEDAPLHRLQRTLETLDHSPPQPQSAAEWYEARKMWVWYLEFEDAGPARQIANQCEDRFQRSIDDEAKQIVLGDPVIGAPETLISASRQDAIAFIRRVSRLCSEVDDDRSWHFARSSMREAGADGAPELLSACAELLAEPAKPRVRDLHLALLEGILTRARRESTVSQVWASIDARAPGASIDARTSVYFRSAMPAVARTFVVEDLDAVADRLAEFVRRAAGAAFGALGHLYVLDRERVRDLVAQAWSHCPDGQEQSCFDELVHALQWRVAGRAPPTDLGADDSRWLLDQLTHVPRPAVRGNVEWYLEDLLRRIGRPSTEWIESFLRERQTRSNVQGYSAVPIYLPLDRFVDLDNVEPDLLRRVLDLAVEDPVAAHMCPRWIWGCQKILRCWQG